MNEKRYIEETEEQLAGRRTTLHGKPVDPNSVGAPQLIDPATGMHGDYWVLTEEERKKGFVRPVRCKYTHVGMRPKHELQDLTPEQLERHKDEGYVKFEPYLPEEKRGLGRYWTQAELDSGCGHSTTMNIAFAETYAREPSFYGSTFCAHCRKHFRVGEHGEFVWDGTEQRVGT